MGTGIALGLTEGSGIYGLALMNGSGWTGFVPRSPQIMPLTGQTAFTNNLTGVNQQRMGYGVTTDASKSGMTTTTHNHNLSTLKAGRFFIRF